MLTGVKVLVDDDRLDKLRRRIVRMLEREVKTQCDGKFSGSYAYQNTSIDECLDDIMEQVKNQIVWQKHAMDRGLL